MRPDAARPTSSRSTAARAGVRTFEGVVAKRKPARPTGSASSSAMPALRAMASASTSQSTGPS
jgi:hypothetical protein